MTKQIRSPARSYPRRTILKAAVVASISTSFSCSEEVKAEKKTNSDLEGAIGVTTSSFSRQLSAKPMKGKVTALDLPRVLRDELDLRVIDLNTSTPASMAPSYLEQLRANAEAAGCVLTNLKMNQRGLRMASEDKAVRERALSEYKKSIDAAAVLGCRWVRPLPIAQRPDLDLLAASFRELIDYGAPKGVSLLIENFGWMQNDPDAIPVMLSKVGDGLAASPDIGNWTSDARYEGLAKSFPHAVTCDFKAKKLGKTGEHSLYDLKKCFEIGLSAGFRGPWCFEHAHETLPGLLRDLAVLKDKLKTWMAER